MSAQLRRHLRGLTEDLTSRDLVAGVLKRHRRRRQRNALAAGAMTLAVIVVGGTIVDLPAGGDEVTPLEPAPTSSAPPAPVELGGTFYYYQRTGPEREEIVAWTVGQEPRSLAEIGTADDQAVEHYAWQTSAVTSDGARVAWRSRFGDLVVIETASGDRHQVDPGEVDLGCHPPVWHPDGTRLLGHTDDSSGWFDVTNAQFQPIDADLTHACAVSVFTTDEGEVALAYADRADHAVVGVTETGRALWRIDIIEVDEWLDPDRGLWDLVQVAPDGRHACLDIQRDVVGGAGGARSLSGNVVVDTGTGEVVADVRPANNLCAAVTDDGYLTRVEPQGGEGQRLHLVGYDGTVLAEVEEPAALAFTTLIGYSPARLR